MRNYDIVTIGDCFEDIFIFPEHGQLIDDKVFASGMGLCFGYGDKVPIKDITYQLGGCAANTAINFSKLKLETGVISVVGSDSRGEKTLDFLQNSGVDTDMVKKAKDSNSNISVIISYKGDRTIFTYHGVDKFSDYVPKKNLKTRWIYLGPLGDDSKIVENRVVEIIAKTACGLMWNPGNKQIRRPIKDSLPILKLCNVLFVNKEEAYEFSDLSRRSSTEDVMKNFHEIGTKIIVVTDGPNGAKCYDGSRFYQIGASGEKRIEATGAGDSFASTFAANIILNSLENKNQGFVPGREIIEKSLKYGVIVSGSVVSSIGAQNGLMTFSQILDADRKFAKLEPNIYAER